MRIGLIQVDGKYPNLALAKLTAYHRARGDNVSWYSPLIGGYDCVYASKVFTETPAYPYMPLDIVCGGLGLDIKARLPAEVEKCRPDFSLWPSWNYSMGYTTRGCIRNCAFCHVPQLEGRLRVIGNLGDIYDGKHKRVRLLDNNLTAAPMEHFKAVCRDAVEMGLSLDFNQGLDARLITNEHAIALKPVRHFKRIHIAWDLIKDEKLVMRGIKQLLCHIVSGQLMCYVLIGFNTNEDEDLYRIQKLRTLGIEPFVMPYNRNDKYQRWLAHWINCRQMKSLTWTEYKQFRMKSLKLPYQMSFKKNLTETYPQVYASGVV